MTHVDKELCDLGLVDVASHTECFLVEHSAIGTGLDLVGLSLAVGIAHVVILVDERASCTGETHEEGNDRCDWDDSQEHHLWERGRDGFNASL